MRTRLLVTFGAVVVLHAAAAVLLLAGLVAAGEPLALGLVLTAYMAGIKHSYEWDHLAAIDNSTRKFVAQRPRNIYVLGFLFGLGFDTATTIGLLVMATAASLAGVSPLALLALPLAFTAAMTLCDTTNGVAMMRMYSSAIHSPQRRLGFNALFTGISAVSALFISFITLGGFFNAAFGRSVPVDGALLLFRAVQVGQQQVPGPVELPGFE